ncbi:GNAT family N-acetyltransferase [Demequina zhanjiangensis]|uniref:GNAT family N-acetyltransferase n=1 Tax=Demequina zhanjiangensis TaxID=3051659 RepID=A0ABT8G3W4_9MICO|nr:GNAT family N-acetyltransferase [Demequina sp. SYSU T00b26]MDN4473389.1 GNAT family N-acetyltransferase [Demequina sp. SYSU T00b26]
MTSPEGYSVVSFDESRADEMISVFSWGFAQRVDADGREDFRRMFPWHRARGIEVTDASRGRVGELAGVRSSHPMELRTPGGGALPAAGLTWVNVHPNHRRRGILSAMLRDHFARARARGEAFSVLFASEPVIYTRFGYSCATVQRSADLRRSPRLREVPGSEGLSVRLETADRHVHGAVIRAVQARMSRPGTPVSVGDTVIEEVFSDPLGQFSGAEPARIAIVEDADGPAAYAVFRRTLHWKDTGAAGEVVVQPWGAVDAAATHRLFSAVTNLDLMTSCQVALGGDDVLPGLLPDVRAAGVKHRDGLWLRILDVEAALGARTYSAPIDAVIEVTDALIPTNAGRWHLRANADYTPTVERTDAPYDIRLDISALGEAILGGRSLTSLADGGRVEESSAGQVLRASRALVSDQAPGCNLAF